MKGSGQGPHLRAERGLPSEGWRTVQVELVRQNMALMQRPLFESSFLSHVGGDYDNSQFLPILRGSSWPPAEWAGANVV